MRESGYSIEKIDASHCKSDKTDKKVSFPVSKRLRHPCVTKFGVYICGVHNEDVPLGSKVVPVLAAAQCY